MNGPYLSISNSIVMIVTCSLCRYRMLSRPYAFGCILRLRTSSEFKPGNSVSLWLFQNYNDTLKIFLEYSLYLFLQYGHFFPDPQYENVQHIICCDSYATYAYDFEFANNVGFSRYLYIVDIHHGSFISVKNITDTWWLCYNQYAWIWKRKGWKFILINWNLSHWASLMFQIQLKSVSSSIYYCVSFCQC